MSAPRYNAAQRDSYARVRDAWLAHERTVQRIGVELGGLVSGREMRRVAERNLKSLFALTLEQHEVIAGAEWLVPQIWRDHEVVVDALKDVHGVSASVRDDSIRAVVRMFAGVSVEAESATFGRTLGSHVPWSTPLPPWATAMRARSQHQLADVGYQMVSPDGKRELFDGSELPGEEDMKLEQAMASALERPDTHVVATLGQAPRSPVSLLLWSVSAARLMQVKDIGSGRDVGAVGSRLDVLDLANSANRAVVSSDPPALGRPETPMARLVEALQCTREARPFLEALESLDATSLAKSDSARRQRVREPIEARFTDPFDIGNELGRHAPVTDAISVALPPLGRFSDAGRI